MPLAAAVVRHRRLAGNVAEMRDVGRRQHQPHAGDGARGRKVSHGKAGMGVRAAQDEGMQAALGRVIVEISPLAGEEPLILDAADGLADSKLRDGHPGLNDWLLEDPAARERSRQGAR